MSLRVGPTKRSRGQQGSDQRGRRGGQARLKQRVVAVVVVSLTVLCFLVIHHLELDQQSRGFDTSASASFGDGSGYVSELSQGQMTGGAAAGTGDVSLMQQESYTTQDLDLVLLQLKAAVIQEGTAHIDVELPGEIPDVAIELLETYQREEICQLAYEGYLDLTGQVWGCAIQGGGWVDIAVIQQREDSQSQMSLTRMYVDEWTQELEESSDTSQSGSSDG